MGEAMKRFFLAILTAAVLLSPTAAYADAGVNFSVAEGFRTGDWRATPLNAEAIVYYKLWLVTFDLALAFNLESWYEDEAADFFFFRPGMRIAIPRILYFRAAIPLEFMEGFNWGFMLGAGRNIINLPALKLFAELDASVTAENGWFNKVPVEFRIGLAVEF